MFVELRLECSFEGMGGMTVTDVRREIIPSLWSTVRERALAKGFSFNMGDAKCPCVLQKNEAVWKECTQLEGLRGRQGMSQRISCDREFTVCSLF